MHTEPRVNYQVSPLFVELPDHNAPQDQSAWALQAARDVSERAARPLTSAEFTRLVGLLSAHAEVHRSRGSSVAGYAAVSDPIDGVDAYVMVKQGVSDQGPLTPDALERLDVNGTPLVGERTVERVALDSGPAIHQFSERRSSFNLTHGVVRSEQYFVMPENLPNGFIMFHAEWLEPYFDDAMNAILELMAGSVRYVHADAAGADQPSDRPSSRRHFWGGTNS